jgi:hypothetical protein
MRSLRVWWKAAGLLLAASPALAEGVPGTMTLPAVGERAAGTAPPPTAPGNVETLPPPRESTAPAPAPAARPALVLPPAAPAAPACAPNGTAKDGHGSWHLWRAEKHADCQAHMWGYPAEFQAPPLGATVHAHFHTMVANGEAAAMVLYHCDFVDGRDVLTQHGRDRLTRIASMMCANGFPLVIERTPEVPALADARRAAVLNVLAMNNIPVPPERVLIGPRIAYGLAGREAEVLYFQQLQSLRIQGTPIPATGTISPGLTLGGGFGGYGGAGGGAGVGGGR